MIAIRKAIFMNNKFGQGFTLLETMIAIVILSSLTLMVLTTTQSMKNRDLVDLEINALRHIVAASRSFHLQQGEWPNSVEQLLQSGLAIESNLLPNLSLAYQFNYSGSLAPLEVNYTASSEKVARRILALHLFDATRAGSKVSFKVNPKAILNQSFKFYALDGSRPLEGDLNMGGNDAVAVNHLSGSTLNTPLVRATGTLSVNNSVSTNTLNMDRMTSITNPNYFIDLSAQSNLYLLQLNTLNSGSLAVSGSITTPVLIDRDSPSFFINSTSANLNIVSASDLTTEFLNTGYLNATSAIISDKANLNKLTTDQLIIDEDLVSRGTINANKFIANSVIKFAKMSSSHDSLFYIFDGESPWSYLNSLQANNINLSDSFDVQGTITSDLLKSYNQLNSNDHEFQRLSGEYAEIRSTFNSNGGSGIAINSLYSSTAARMSGLLNVSGESTFQNTTTFGNLRIAGLTTTPNMVVTNTLTTPTISTSYITDSPTSNYRISSDGTARFKNLNLNSLRITSASVAGGSCSGFSVGVSNDGGLLNCKNGKWEVVSGGVGEHRYISQSPFFLEAGFDVDGLSYRLGTFSPSATRTTLTFTTPLQFEPLGCVASSKRGYADIIAASVDYALAQCTATKTQITFRGSLNWDIDYAVIGHSN